MSSEGAYAIGEASPIHSSGDQQHWNRKTNQVELIGHARVEQPGEILTADYILLDQNLRTVDARGNCVYVAVGTTIRGERMHFNLDTRTGTIEMGRVSNDAFTLAGERINKLGEGRFQTHWGEYSTCRDCAQSWSLEAKDVDLELEGYAFMSEVTTKIKDTPSFWLPYLIMPMKTRRQSGFTFPTFGTSAYNGFMLELPYFWAINRSSDMTFAVGDWSSRGKRAEWEGRYMLSPRSSGKANFYYLQDSQFSERPNRWATNVVQTQELPFGIEEKFQLMEMSDNLYPRKVGDITSVAGEPVSPSELILNYPSPNVNGYLAIRRYRNLFDVDPDRQTRDLSFDGKTVQIMPTAVITTTDRFIPGTPVATGLALGVTNFARAGGAADFDDQRFGASPNPLFPQCTPLSASFNPGCDPIREATRFSLVPVVYTTFRPWDLFSVTPSLQYNAYFYSFPGSSSLPGYNIAPPGELFRAYPLLQVDLGMQLERIFEFPETPGEPRAKHLIRPLLQYSFIPEKLVKSDNNHPFLEQISYNQSYRFDNNDLVPLDRLSTGNSVTNYSYTPLGNSLTYGFLTQWIARKGALDAPGKEAPTPEYATRIEFSAGETYNFRESGLYNDSVVAHAQNPSIPIHDNQPVNRLFSALALNYNRWNMRTDYSYFPYIDGMRHQLTSSMSYTLDKGIRQRVLNFERSATLSYIWNEVGCTPDQPCNNPRTQSLRYGLVYSINDYIMPSMSAEYSLLNYPDLAIQRGYLSENFGVVFQSPSQCWRFTVNVGYNRDTGWNPAFNLELNLTGAGFGGVTDLATQATTQQGKTD